MTKLEWLTSRDIYLWYLNEEAVLDDGRTAREVIDELQSQLAFETYAYMRAEAKAEDRWAYEQVSKPLQARIRQVEAEVFSVMMEDAARGRWIGFGRRHPDAKEEVIPSRYWPFLSFDIEKAIAKGEDMTFRGVRGLIRRRIPKDHPILDQIRVAETIRKTPDVSPLNDGHGRSAEAAGVPVIDDQEEALSKSANASRHDVEPTGMPALADQRLEPRVRGVGRPSSVELVAENFCKRAEADEALPVFRAEAIHQSGWLREAHPDKAQMKSETIEDQIRSLYKAWKAGENLREAHAAWLKDRQTKKKRRRR